jgi:hypothetical protein
MIENVHTFLFHLGWCVCGLVCCALVYGRYGCGKYIAVLEVIKMKFPPSKTLKTNEMKYFFDTLQSDRH